MRTDLREALDGAAPRRVPDLDFDRLWRRHRRAQVRNRIVVVATIAVAIGIAASLLPVQPSVEIEPVDQGLIDAEEIGVGPAETVQRMVHAINTRDADAFTDAFVEEGSFHARGQFPETSSPFANDQLVADTELVEAWMVFVDTWGHEAQVRRCERREDLTPGMFDGGVMVTCEVTTRWHTLSMEITEQWEYEFSGDLLRSWRHQPLDLDPQDRSLPLGFSGLEQWETWLQANRPDDAARYLSPRDPSCGGCELQWVEDLTSDDPGRLARMGPLMFSTERAWNINGHTFVPAGLIPYNPAFADEIEAAIHAHLESR